MKSDTVAATAKELSEPQGIGMAVAFDWGLAVQILVTPFLALVLGVPGYLSSFKQFNFSPPVAAVNSTEARKRHGGVWPWLILLWAVVGGVLQALSTFYPAER